MRRSIALVLVTVLGGCVRLVAGPGRDQSPAADAPRAERPAPPELAAPLSDLPAGPTRQNDFAPGDRGKPDLLMTKCATWTSWKCTAAIAEDAGVGAVACVATCGNSALTCDVVSGTCSCNKVGCVVKFDTADCSTCSNAFAAGCCKP